MPSTELKRVLTSDVEEVVGGRIEYGDLRELAETISKVGFIHPIAVCPLDGAPGKYQVLAGRRRLRAARMAKVPEIPVQVFHITDQLDKREIELIENIQRKDMDWAEEVVLKRQIHELMLAKHGNVKGEGWTMEKTAKRFGESKGNTSKDIALAKAIEFDPRLRDCKDKAEAAKALSIVKQNAVLGALNKRLEKEGKAPAVSSDIAQPAFDAETSPSFDDVDINEFLAEASDEKAKDSITTATNPLVLNPVKVNHKKINTLKEFSDKFILSDCVAGMRKMSPNTFHMAEIDPPYAIELAKNKANVTHSYNEIDREDYPEFMETMLTETYRLLRDGSWVVLWHAYEWSFEMRRILIDVGFELPAQMPGLWIKNKGQCNQPAKRLASAYEPFWYARKGNASIIPGMQGHLNYYSHSGISPKDKYHPTQRPLPLIRDILKTFCSHGTVLVPFLGSGATMLAAHFENLDCVGFELSEEYKKNFLGSASLMLK